MRKNVVKGVLLSSLVIMGPAYAAESPFSIRSALKVSQARTEGSTFNMQQMDVGAYYGILPWFKPGLSLAVEQADRKTNLFDSYTGIGLNADFLFEAPSSGSFLPFLLIRIPFFHRFQASGKINRHITNGTDKGDGTIEIPSATSPITTSSPRDGKFGYTLDGNALGIGVDVGCGFKVTEDLSLTTAVGYSWRSLTVTKSRGSDYSMVGGAEYAYDQRHGVQASGKTLNEGYDVKPERKSRFLGAASVSLGLDYKI